jgi:serine/threonine-protein kinase
VEVGRIIGGKYRLRRQIGEGGMGSVWAGVHETLDRNVAIKFLRPSVEDAQTAAARFVTEAKSAARVKHRFVVDVFDFGITEDGVYYMVQELLEGEELADCFDHGSAWEVRDVVNFVAQCLAGLEAVHQAGIVHRDLKPENIFVMRDSDGRYPKLLDFGISKLADGPLGSTSAYPPSKKGRSKQLTTAGTALGTPWYMSPEQLRGRRDLDGRADVYSIGVITYEWLTGRVPYDTDNVAELALQVASGSAVPLVSLRPELGHELSAVIARALSPEPQERFATAGEMRQALQALAPKLPTAFSIVHKPGKSAGGPIGSKTELLLQAAANAFGQEPSDALEEPLAQSKKRPLLIAAAVLLVLGLSSIPFFREARPDRASAKEEAAAAVPPRAVEKAPAPQPSPPIPAAGEGTGAGSAAAEQAQQPAPAAEAQTRALAPQAPKADRPAVRRSARAREKRGHKSSNKKVIRTLDF